MNIVPSPLDLSIVIPARQEALRLPATIEQLQIFLKEKSIKAEIIPVIQGDDSTASLVCALARIDPQIKPIIDPQGRGKGRAVRSGIAQASGTIILFIDADLSVPLQALEALLEQLLNSPSCDILIASRHLPGSNITIFQPLQRRLLGRLFNYVLRFLKLTSFSDTQCGCKLFRHDAAKNLFSYASIDGFAFDVEILLLAERLGYHVQEAPTEWADAGNSRLGLSRDGLQALRDIWNLRALKKTWSRVIRIDS